LAKSVILTEPVRSGAPFGFVYVIPLINYSIAKLMLLKAVRSEKRN
jgi:hypothetical protein